MASEIPALKCGRLEAFREVPGAADQAENVGIGFIPTIRGALDENIEIYEDYNSVFAGFICSASTSSDLFGNESLLCLTFALKSSFRRQGIMESVLTNTLDAMTELYYYAPAVVRRNKQCTHPAAGRAWL